MRTEQALLILGLWAIWPFATPASAEAIGASPIPNAVVASWTEKDGLPSASVWSIAQTPDGYLWLSTGAGLVRFDGVRFVPWNESNHSLLPDGGGVLCVARDGSLWLGTNSSAGVTRIRGLEARRYGVAEGLTGGAVTGLVEEHYGEIWAATHGGVFVFRGEQWNKVGLADGLPEGPAYSVYEDNRGHLWIGTSAGVFRRLAGTHTFQQVANNHDSQQKIIEDLNRALWITDPIWGVKRLGDRGLTTQVSKTRGAGVGLLNDRHGNLWVATLGQGLWRLPIGQTTASQMETITIQTGLSSNSIRALFEDVDGNIWVGTQYGLHRISFGQAIPLTTLGLVRAVEADREGRIWVGTTSGLFQFSGSERRDYGQKDGLPPSVVKALHVDRTGAVWVATDHGLFRSSDGRRFSLRRLPRGLSFDDPSALATDPHGSVWLMDFHKGLYQWKGDSVRPFGTATDVTNRTVYVDSSGRIWTSFPGGGLGLIDQNGDRKSYGRSDGVRIGIVKAIHEDSQHVVWFGGTEGIARIADGHRFVSVSQANGLPNDSVSSLVDDENGNLWLGTNAGIIRLDRREVGRISSDPTYRIHYTLFDASDGLAGMPMWLGTPSAARERNGRLWFVTGNGLSIIDPRSVDAPRAPPPVRIESLSVDGRSTDLLPQVRVGPGPSTLEIDYTALAFSSPGKVQFRYRLEGYDKSWMDAGRRRQAMYTNLPPRSYRFTVIASRDQSAWDESNAATLDLYIEPRFYESRWFYPACGLLIGLAVVGAWQFRLRQVQRQFSLVLAERVRIGREVHDTLLQSLVGVALQLDFLSGSLGEASQSAKDRLLDMRDQVEEYIRDAHESIWDLRSSGLQRSDLPTALRDAGERATVDTAVSFDFTVSGVVHPCSWDVERQLLRIGQEAISNAVRHARATHLQVILEYNGDAIRISVSDDGCGFTHNRGYPGHCGLATMRERAEDAGGQFAISSTPGRGTIVEAILPAA